MRKALNENPLVQVALIGLLALVVGFLLITRMGGSGSEAAPPTSSPTAAAPVATPGPAASAAAPGATADGAAPAGPDGASGEFAAGPGLPAKVVDAYDSGKAVVVLIVHREGFDDRKLESQVRFATGGGSAAVFVVEAKDIADYSRIAEGVDVDRVPALVVIEPKSRADGPLPEASIGYGYRGPDSVAQAVRDALYKGPEDLPYHP